MKNGKKALKHLKRAQELLSKRKSSFEDMTEEEIITRLRKTREQVWEEKLAHRS